VSEYPITIEEIISWLRSKERALGDSGVTLSEVRERRIHVSAVAADFDSSCAIGRISVWVSGEIDFQVLRREGGEDVLFRHATVSRMDGPDLEGAYADFLRLMSNPGSAGSNDTVERLQAGSLDNT
jgi:hypothetical protein